MIKEEIHSTKQRRQFTSLNERESLTELRVICAIAGQWGQQTYRHVVWSPPYSLELVMEVETVVLK